MVGWSCQILLLQAQLTTTEDGELTTTRRQDRQRRHGCQAGWRGWTLAALERVVVLLRIVTAMLVLVDKSRGCPGCWAALVGCLNALCYAECC